MDTETYKEEGHVTTETAIAAVSQGMPRNVTRSQKLGIGKKGYFPRAFRGNMALPRSWAPKLSKNKFLLF